MSHDATADATKLLEDGNAFKNAGSDFDLRDITAQKFADDLADVAKEDQRNPGYYAKVIQQMKTQSDASWFYPKVEIVDGNTVQLKENLGDYWQNNEYELDGSLTKNHQVLVQHTSSNPHEVFLPNGNTYFAQEHHRREIMGEP